jgi:hypothetical protein
MVLAVRVVGHSASGATFDELTHTLDVAIGGARLGGMQRLLLEPGDVIEVRRKNRKANFTVMWVGESGTPRTGQVGLQSVDAPSDFWGIDVPVEGEVPIPVTGRIVHHTEHAG